MRISDWSSDVCSSDLVASQDIAAGQHVHTHNVQMADLTRAYDFCTSTKDLSIEPDRVEFMGIRRSDGRVATRNYMGILTIVNCSATVASASAAPFRREL